MEHQISGGAYNLLHVTTTEYNLVCGETTWDDDPDERAEPISTPGKLKNLRVELNDVPGTGTYTFTLHRAVGLGAWANTALTCTVAADGTIASDMVNEVAVAAGDVICLECDPDAPDNARYAKWTMVFEGDNANESLLLANARTGVSDSWMRPMGGSGVNFEDSCRCVCPTSGTIKNLFVWLSEDPGYEPGDAYAFYLRIAGVSQLLTCQITQPNRTCNNVANEIAVVAGDVLTIFVDPISSPTHTPSVALGMTFVADIDGESLILGGSREDLDATATEYNHLIPYVQRVWTATEAERYQLAQECTLKKLYTLLSDSPGAGKKYVFTVRQNDASPADGLVVEIADAATTGNDVGHTITIANDDELDLEVNPDGTPTVRDAYWGLVSYREAAPPPPEEPKHTFRLHPRPGHRMEFHPNLQLG